MEHIDVFGAPVFIVGVSAGLLGFFVLVREHASRVSVAFFAVALCVAIWLTTYLFIYSSPNESTALAAARFVGAIGISFIPTTVFAFAFEISENAKGLKPLVPVGIALSAFFYLATVLTPWIVPTVQAFWWGYYPRFGHLSYLYLLYFVVFMGLSIFLFARQYLRAATVKAKRRIRLLLVAAAVASIANVDFLAVFGVAVYPFGYLAVFGCLLVIGRVITRYRFMDITPAEMAGQILDAMNDGLIVCDRSGTIRVANPAAKRFFRRDLEGKRIEWATPIPAVDAETAGSPRDCDARVFHLVDRAGERTLSVSTSVMHDAQSEPLGSLFVARDISEQVRAVENIKRQAEHLAALHSIDTAITGSMDLRLTLEVVIKQVVAQLHADAATILLYERHTNTLEYGAGAGLPLNAVRRSTRADDGVYLEIALERKPVRRRLSVDSDTGSSRLAELAREGVRTYHARPLVARGTLHAVLEVLHFSDFVPDEDWREFFVAVSEQAAIAIDNGMLFSELQRSNGELRLAYENTLEGWALALELRDVETKGHSSRVSLIAVRLGEALGLDGDALLHLRRGALLHDIGKMGIPDSILFKKGLLTAEEWEVMQRHPAIAFEMLNRIPFLRPAIDVPYCHHEKWDGSGYPRRLLGAQIPFAARIFAIVDVWDALRSKRAYHEPWSDEEIRSYLLSRSGIDFDPDVVSVFVTLNWDADQPGGLIGRGAVGTAAASLSPFPAPRRV